MKSNKTLVSFIAVAFLIAGLAACQKKEETAGPAETAGQKIDEAAATANQKVEETTAKIGEKMEEAGKSIQQSADDAKK